MRAGAALYGLASALLVSGCGGGSPADAPEGDEPETFTVEALYAQVDQRGFSGPFPRERFEGMKLALPGAPDDVLCITHVWRPDDCSALRAALADEFPYTFEVETDDDTLVDDPADAQGVVPPPPEAPPCTGDDIPKLDAQLACMAENCSTLPGDLDGQVTDLDCLPACNPTHAELDNPADPKQLCHACYHRHLWSDASWNETHERCTTLLEPLGYHGDAGMIVFSRWPIEQSATVVLPGWPNRRTIASVRVRSPAGSSLDVHCAQLDNPSRDDYAGRYGDVVTGYATEHALQIQQLLAHVDGWSEGGPALVVGQLYTSAHYTIPGGLALEELAPDQMDRLQSALDLAVPEDFVPACTICPGNPLVGAAIGSAGRQWLNPIFASGLDPGAFEMATRTWLGDVVSVTPSKASHNEGRVPISPEYGFRVRVRLE